MIEEAEKLAVWAEAALERGDLPAANLLYAQALEAFTRRDDYIGRVVACMGLAEVCQRTDDLSCAVTHLEAALALAQERGDGQTEGRIMLRLAAVHVRLSAPLVAIAYLDGALPFVVPPDPDKADPAALIAAYDTLTTLADLLATHNRPHDAIAHYRHALVYVHRLDDGQRAICVLDKIIPLLHNIGNSAAARKAADARAALERQRPRP